ncbi:MAG: helix-turn-helix transcriptional regulator [Schwartzia sp.]|nr:helix-turn-helix transcriptional regulator [Schwartzia sp. (in: firmicutes)]
MVIGDASMFGDRLRYIRKHQEFSQAEAAEALGLSPVSYNRYECGQREPDFDTLRKIAQFFHVSLDYLLGNDEDAAEDIVDFSHFILHGNYTIDAHFPEERERKMIHDLVRAVYDNQRK